MSHNPMTRSQILLVQLMEECAEVQQRCAKALRFGLDERHPEHEENNSEMIYRESQDLVSVLNILTEEGWVGPGRSMPLGGEYEQYRRNKIERYMGYSADCGCATPDAPNRGAENTDA